MNKQIKEVAKAVEMFKSYLTGISQALIPSLSNAVTERLNGKIQEVKLAGRGCRTFRRS